jgi:hypothetical protein
MVFGEVVTSQVTIKVKIKEEHMNSRLAQALP